MSASLPDDQKHSIRSLLKQIREQISKERRLEAKQALLEKLYPQLEPYQHILSFSSLPQEIDTRELNALLASQKRLLLPKIEGEFLRLFKVECCATQLTVSSAKILEPIASLCSISSLEECDCVLVPALGFDTDKQRLGYGKGYYDRLIASAKNCVTPPFFIGIGFKEQHVIGKLPCGPHDQTLDAVFLF